MRRRVHLCHPALDIATTILGVMKSQAGADRLRRRAASKRGTARPPLTRFSMSISLGELAVRFGCELRGNPEARVDRVATLARADSHSLAFLANPHYRQQVATTSAGAVVLDAASAADCATAALVCENPHATYARIAAHPAPVPDGSPGTHSSAVIALRERASISAHVGAFSVIGEGAIIGARAFIGPHCLVEGAIVGEDARLTARVTICHHVEIGTRTVIQPGAVIGGNGFRHAGARPLDQGAADRHRPRRARRRDRRQHDDRSRRHRGYSHRGGREARQSDHDRAQRAGWRPQCPGCPPASGFQAARASGGAA